MEAQGVARPSRRGRRAGWTESELRGLGVRTDLRTAADVLGIGETHAYRLAGRNQFPVPVIPVGRRYVVPVAGLLSLLGIDPNGGPAA